LLACLLTTPRCIAFSSAHLVSTFVLKARKGGLMTGISPAFIANQLGYSVEMLRSIFAKWMAARLITQVSAA